MDTEFLTFSAYERAAMALHKRVNEFVGDYATKWGELPEAGRNEYLGDVVVVMTEIVSEMPPDLRDAVLAYLLTTETTPAAA